MEEYGKKYASDFAIKLDEMTKCNECFNFTYENKSTGALLELQDIPCVDLKLNPIQDSFIIENEHLYFLEYFNRFPSHTEENPSIFKITSPEKEVTFSF